MARRLILAFTFVAVPLAVTEPSSSESETYPRWQLVHANAFLQKAFSCKPGAPMIRANACHVW